MKLVQALMTTGFSIKTVVCVCVRVCVCARARAYVRACWRVYMSVCARACVRASVCVRVRRASKKIILTLLLS